MAKVLISPIGTGKMVSDREYQTAKYKFDDNDRIYETPFVSAALAEYLKVDKIIFIGTAKSMWEEIYRYFAKNADKDIDDNYWLKIAELSNSSGYNKKLVNKEDLATIMFSVDEYLKAINSKATGGSLPLIIDYGLNEEELWKNFSTFMKLTEILNDGDEIYLDITHSFRSIPLFMYLMMEFMQILAHKKIMLKGLYYGMLEAKWEVSYAPIVDLKPLFEISQWIRGTHDFVNYGNGYIISELLEKDKSTSKNMEEMQKKIKNISDLVNINYLVDLQKQIQALNKLIDSEYKNAITYVLPLIKDFTSRFKDIEYASEFQLELSRWYFENKKYGHGYICLVESVLTKLCEVYELDITDFDNREKVKKKILSNRRYQRKIKDLKNLADKYFPVNDIRNRIAHASFYNDNNYSFSNDINQAMSNYEDIKKLLEREGINKLNESIPACSAFI